MDASYDTFSGPSGASDQADAGVEYSETGETISHSIFFNVKRAVSTWDTTANLTDDTISGATAAYSNSYAGRHTDGNTFTHNQTNVELDWAHL